MRSITIRQTASWVTSRVRTTAILPEDGADEDGDRMLSVAAVIERSRGWANYDRAKGGVQRAARGRKCSRVGGGRSGKVVDG
jgi:hypothetical protein